MDCFLNLYYNTDGDEKITYCYNCLKACDPSTAKYCISQALINAVQGDTDNGLIFSSTRVGEISEISTVKEVMDDLYPNIKNHD